jgi:hypothetical protein
MEDISGTGTGQCALQDPADGTQAGECDRMERRGLKKGQKRVEIDEGGTVQGSTKKKEKNEHNPLTTDVSEVVTVNVHTAPSGYAHLPARVKGKTASLYRILLVDTTATAAVLAGFRNGRVLPVETASICVFRSAVPPDGSRADGPMHPPQFTVACGTVCFVSDVRTQDVYAAWKKFMSSLPVDLPVGGASPAEAAFMTDTAEFQPHMAHISRQELQSVMGAASCVHCGAFGDHVFVDNAASNTMSALEMHAHTAGLFSDITEGDYRVRCFHTRTPTFKTTCTHARAFTVMSEWLTAHVCMRE